VLHNSRYFLWHLSCSFFLQYAIISQQVTCPLKTILPKNESSNVSTDSCGKFIFGFADSILQSCCDSGRHRGSDTGVFVGFYVIIRVGYNLHHFMLVISCCVITWIPHNFDFVAALDTVLLQCMNSDLDHSVFKSKRDRGDCFPQSYDSSQRDGQDTQTMILVCLLDSVW
jgi:hypothetical protein